MQFRGFLLLLALAGPAPGAHADLQAGIEAVQNRDYETAFEELLPAAEAGNARAQALVANMYRRGYGVQRDYASAAEWYARAAEQGYPSAQYNLGVHLREGLGVDADNEAATEWFRKSAEQGFAPAQINLGLRYASGTTVPRDDVLAYAWLHKAAGQGDHSARRKRDLIGKRLTDEDIERAKRMSYSLY